MASSLINAEVFEAKEFSKVDISGEVFEGPRAIKETIFGANALNVDSLESSDGKFFTGMYKCDAVVETHIDEPYGVDEFMYIISGSITLKSISGLTQVIEAGEAVSLPKEWRGTWESDGYTKLWVIYSPEGEEETVEEE